MKKFKALVLDWDGVFHDGRKAVDGSSTFSEIDSMGLNLLRFAHHQQQGMPLPVAIVTGERNPSAEAFAQREHLDAFCFNAQDKRLAIPFLETLWGIPAHDWAFVFDDILDLGLAKEVAFRAMVQRTATQETVQFAQRKGLVDMVLQGDHAVREFAERNLVEMGQFDAALAERIAVSTSYQSYWKDRQALPTLLQDLSSKDLH